MFFGKRFQTLALIVVLALLSIGALLLLMGYMAAPPPSPLEQAAPAAGPTPTATGQPPAAAPAQPPTPAEEELIATVNNISITRQEWRLATRLDAVMSRLAAQPIPTAEETLDRLINEILVLSAVEAAPTPQQSQVQSRIEALADSWRISDDSIGAALAESDLSRNDLSLRVGRLLQVESALSQLTAQKGDLNQWLQEVRANSEIGLYRSLGRAPQVAVAAAEAVAAPAEAVATAALAQAEQPQRFAPPPDMATAPYPGNAAPDFSLATLNGDSVTLSELRGKPVIINFWATWCPPCRRELPALQAAYERHRAEIGFVAIDVKEDAQKVTAFVEELGLTFPVVFDGDGRVSDVAYQVRGIPTTIFVDANGVVSDRHVGPLDEAAIEAYLQPLLAPPVASVEIPADAVAGDAAASTATQPDEPAADTVLPPAPDFSLTSADGEVVALQDLLASGQSVVVVFYRGHT